jgi:hypothetical protein
MCVLIFLSPLPSPPLILSTLYSPSPLLQLIGIALIAVGSYLIASGNSFEALTGNHFFSGAALLIICGIAVFFITGAGIVGAFFQWRPVLYIVSESGRGQR